MVVINVGNLDFYNFHCNQYIVIYTDIDIEQFINGSRLIFATNNVGRWILTIIENHALQMLCLFERETTINISEKKYRSRYNVHKYPYLLKSKIASIKHS